MLIGSRFKFKTVFQPFFIFHNELPKYGCCFESAVHTRLGLCFFDAIGCNFSNAFLIFPFFTVRLNR